MEDNLAFRDHVWKPQHKPGVKIRYMTNGHLLNTVKFIARKKDFWTAWMDGKTYSFLIAEIEFRGLEYVIDPHFEQPKVAPEPGYLLVGATKMCVMCFKPIHGGTICRCRFEKDGVVEHADH